MVSVVIKSAETMRAIAEPMARQREIERLKQEKENLIKEQEIEQKRKEGIKKVIEYLNKKIEEESLKGYMRWSSHEIYANHFIYQTLYRFYKDIDVVEQLLTEAGYKVYIHEYCESWRKKTGKIAWITIEWEE